jgi:hypothetical protein
MKSLFLLLAAPILLLTCASPWPDPVSFSFVEPTEGSEWDITSPQSIQWESSGAGDDYTLVLWLSDGFIIGNYFLEDGQFIWEDRTVYNGDIGKRIERPGNYTLKGQIYDGPACLTGEGCENVVNGKIVAEDEVDIRLK